MIGTMLEGCTPWPEDLAARYRREGYWRGETLAELVRAWATREPTRVALVMRDRCVSYGELDQRVDTFAAGLVARGIRSHDRIVLQLANGIELVTTALALFRIGALPIFALLPHRRSEITYLVQIASAVGYVIPDVAFGFDYRTLATEVQAACPTLATVIVAGSPGAFVAWEAVRAAPVELVAPRPDDVAFFMLSGGTTGAPKLIPRTHDDYAYQLRATAECMAVGPDAVYLASLPVGHNAALGCPGVLGTLRAGGRVVLPRTPSPDDVFPLIAQHGVTLTTLVPSLVSLWIDTAPLFKADVSRVVLQVGGARLEPEVADRVRPVLGCRMSHWFGMAEGLLSFARLDESEGARLQTQGHPLAAADEIAIVDDRGTPVSPGEVGELLTRGPYTIRGYYRADDYNARVFTPDGFLRTGDLVRLTADGNLVVEGRLKDVINRGGEKVPAEEVEALLVGHPDITAVAIVATPDPALGERSCAFVVPAAAARPKLSDLKRFLRDQGLADFKLPDRLEVIDALPRTNIGKIDKAKLRKLAAGDG